MKASVSLSTCRLHHSKPGGVVGYIVCPCYRWVPVTGGFDIVYVYSYLLVLDTVYAHPSLAGGRRDGVGGGAEGGAGVRGAGWWGWVVGVGAGREGGIRGGWSGRRGVDRV